MAKYYKKIAYHGSVLYVPRTRPKTLIERLRETIKKNYENKKEFK